MIQTVAVLFGVILIWLAAALYIVQRLGLSLHQAILYAPLKIAYRIDDSLMRTARKAESPVIYVVLHQSRLDPALMLSLLPPETLHILDPESAQSVWLEPWRELARTIEFKAHHVFVSRRLVRHLRGKGRLAVYLPDEVEPDAKAFRLYRAVARIATKSDAKIVPIFVDGSRHSWFSLTPAAIAPRKFMSKLAITALTPATITELRERPSRPPATASNALFDYCATARFMAADCSRSLFCAVRDAADLYGHNRTVLGDRAQALTYRQLLARARRIGKRLSTTTKEGETVALLLPDAPELAVSLLALNASGRIAALPGRGADTERMAKALETAEIKTVLSSNRHIEEVGLTDLVAKLEERGIRTIRLEDIEQSASIIERLGARKLWHQPLVKKSGSRPAVLLFKTDSASEPSAVVLSDRNLLANVMQLATRLEVSPLDRVLNAHSLSDGLGLTAGLLLPLLSGAETRFAPSPAEPMQYPKFRAAADPTILIGSDSFLAAYAGAAQGDSSGVRTVIESGAGLRPETSRLWANHFGITIIEAFGLSEAGGVVAIGSLPHNRVSSAGRLLPGMEIRLEPVEGMTDGGGRLWVCGPNVMLGYLHSDAPGILQPPLGGWHDTGEAVSIDREGFFTLHGRAERVVAMDGEILSLDNLEALANGLWPQARHAVVAVTDRRKAVRIVLVTTADDADRNVLRQSVREAGRPEKIASAEIIKVAELPRTEAGKIDYSRVSEIARSQRRRARAA
jgi:acyl-[acyl-carrier-protein]-phospholipid O-acyltransferase/long-chain-fatty-acid--[acyl-carrier-protein] ligase